MKQICIPCEIVGTLCTKDYVPSMGISQEACKGSFAWRWAFGQVREPARTSSCTGRSSSSPKNLSVQLMEGVQGTQELPNGRDARACTDCYPVASLVGVSEATECNGASQESHHLPEKGLSNCGGALQLTRHPVAPAAEQPGDLSPQSVVQKKEPRTMDSYSLGEVEKSVLLSGRSDGLHACPPPSPPTFAAAPSNQQESRETSRVSDSEPQCDQNQQQQQGLQGPVQSSEGSSVGDAQEQQIIENLPTKSLPTFTKEELLHEDANDFNLESSVVEEKILQGVGNAKKGNIIPSLADSLHEEITHCETVAVPAEDRLAAPTQASTRGARSAVSRHPSQKAAPIGDASRGTPP